MPQKDICLEWENTTPNHQSTIIREWLRVPNSLTKVCCFILGAIYSVCLDIITWQQLVAVELRMYFSDIR